MIQSKIPHYCLFYICIRIVPTCLLTSIWLPWRGLTISSGSNILGFKPNSLTNLYDIYESVPTQIITSMNLIKVVICVIILTRMHNVFIFNLYCYNFYSIHIVILFMRLVFFFSYCYHFWRFLWFCWSSHEGGDVARLIVAPSLDNGKLSFSSFSSWTLYIDTVLFLIPSCDLFILFQHSQTKLINLLLLCAQSLISKDSLSSPYSYITFII